MIAKGVDWFESQRREHLSVFVSYLQYGATTPIEVRATIGGSRFDYVDATGQIVRSECRDFLISASDLPGDPGRGDTITETAASGVIRVYEVAIVAGAPNAWSWGDRSQRIRRIHTQLIEER